MAGLFVAVGKGLQSTIIGYSSDGNIWNLATDTNELFLGDNGSGYAYGIAYGNDRFVAVGQGNQSKIGYSTNGGDTWNLASVTNGLFQEGRGLAIAFAPGSAPPPPVCFKAGSKILTDKGYKAIEELRKGDLVKTLLNGYKPIALLGKSELYHPAALTDRLKDQLYVCSQAAYPDLLEDLVLTGCHSILVDEFASAEQKEKVLAVHKKIYVTNKKYRLPACVDERSAVYPEAGTYTIFHLALEHDNERMNYGIYANGLLVESCSKRQLREMSGMTFIE